MTREDRKRAVAEYIEKNTAHMSILCQIRGHDDPEVRRWVDMRNALGLTGWSDTDETVAAIENLFGESGEN